MGDVDAAANRAYYAMFDVARAVLITDKHYGATQVYPSNGAHGSEHSFPASELRNSWRRYAQCLRHPVPLQSISFHWKRSPLGNTATGSGRVKFPFTLWFPTI